MGSRERRRAERRKRKERTIERYSERTEAKNREARETLEPLPEGDRPPVVTASAIVSAIFCTLAILGYALWPVLRDDQRPELFGGLMFIAITGAMAYGLWRTRYWAVLGFMVFLVFFMLAAARGLALEAATLGEIVGNLVLLGGAGVFFFFMVKALARIQMPERPGNRD